MDAGAEKKQEVFIEMFFSDEEVRCVATTQSLLEHWDGMSALRIVMRSVIIVMYRPTLLQAVTVIANDVFGIVC